MAMTLRLDEEHVRKLDELAQCSSASKHGTVLCTIDGEFNRMAHRQCITDVLDQTVERWGDTFERLGQQHYAVRVSLA